MNTMGLLVLHIVIIVTAPLGPFKIIPVGLVHYYVPPLALPEPEDR